MEEYNWIIQQLVTDNSGREAYRIGCFKKIGSNLCNFTGLTIDNKGVAEYSYAKRNVDFPKNAKIINEENYLFVIDILKSTFVTVNRLIRDFPTDSNSRCFVVTKNDCIYLINDNPESEWNNFELIKREIPTIHHLKDIILPMLRDDVDKKLICESLFYDMMNIIQNQLVLIKRYLRGIIE